MTATHCPALNMKLEYDDMIFYVLTTYLRLLAIWFTYLFRLLVTYPTSITPVARTRFTFHGSLLYSKMLSVGPKKLRITYPASSSYASHSLAHLLPLLSTPLPYVTPHLHLTVC